MNTIDNPSCDCSIVNKAPGPHHRRATRGGIYLPACPAWCATTPPVAGALRKGARSKLGLRWKDGDSSGQLYRVDDQGEILSLVGNVTNRAEAEDIVEHYNSDRPARAVEPSPNNPKRLVVHKEDDETFHLYAQHRTRRGFTGGSKGTIGGQEFADELVARYNGTDTRTNSLMNDISNVKDAASRGDDDKFSKWVVKTLNDAVNRFVRT